MAKVKYDDVDIRLFKETAVGRAYLEYNDKVGGEPFNPSLDLGDIDLEEAYGGMVGLYHECIKQGKTWEELLGTDGKWDILPVEE